MLRPGKAVHSPPFIAFVLLIHATFSAAQPLERADALAQCRSTFEALVAGGSSPRARLDEDFERFQRRAEQSLAYRAKSIRVFRKLTGKVDRDEPLSGSDLRYLTEGMIAYLDLRDALYDAVNAYRCWPTLRHAALDDGTRLKGAMLSLSASLVLYDNYLLAISLFEEDRKLRRYLNEAHSGYNLARFRLREVTEEYNRVANRAEARRVIRYFKKHWPAAAKSFRDNADNQYLYLLITQSPSYNATLKLSPGYVLSQRGRFLAGYTADALDTLKSNGLNLFSMVFGNTMGLIQTRKGRLYGDAGTERAIERELRAGDILLEKTPFRLTDKFIPGYWGHVAIWSGTEQELRALGIWNHPVVKPFQEEIRAGNRVIEALRSGVVISPLRQFLDIDDLAVLRRPALSDETRKRVILRSFRQVGKPYDFNFDVETNDKIVCSELIYVTYTDIDWPTQKTLGRYTISPTHIAEKSNGKDTPFELVMLYLDGTLVTDNINQRFAALH
jgi:hypothetical protein